MRAKGWRKLKKESARVNQRFLKRPKAEVGKLERMYSLKAGEDFPSKAEIMANSASLQELERTLKGL